MSLGEVYNCKVITYSLTGEQDIRIYKNPIVSTSSRSVPSESHYDDYAFLGSCDETQVDIDSFRLIRDVDLYKKEMSVKRSMRRTKGKVYDYARANVWEYFVTLTFNPNLVDRYDFDFCVSKMSQWLKDIRKRKCSDLKYIGVPEKHKDGAFHFHFLFSYIGDLELIDSGKKDNGKVIFNLGNYKYGWSTATRVSDTSKVSNYITKYITKDLCSSTFGRKRYWNSRNLEVGEVKNVLMDIKDIYELRDFAKKNATYEKVVDVCTDDYSNSIEYYTIKF